MSSSRKPALRSPRPKGAGSEVEGSAGQLLAPRPAGLRITLVKSPTGYSEHQKRTVRALGLRRLRQTVEQADTPVVRGMIAKIPHLVSVEPALQSPRPKGAGSGAEGEVK